MLTHVRVINPTFSFKHGSFGKPYSLRVCLACFQPSLVPPPQNDNADSDVEAYFDSDYDADESDRDDD